MWLLKLTKAGTCLEVVEFEYTTTPPQKAGWWNAQRSNSTTIPKLFEPPFTAWNRSGFSL